MIFSPLIRVITVSGAFSTNLIRSEFSAMGLPLSRGQLNHSGAFPVGMEFRRSIYRHSERRSLRVAGGGTGNHYRRYRH